MSTRNPMASIMFALPFLFSFMFAGVLTAQDGHSDSHSVSGGTAVQQETRTAPITMARGASASGPMSPVDARVLSTLRSVLATEASFGNTPANSRLLAELNALVVRSSGPIAIPKKVAITNFGPARLKVEKPDGSFVYIGSGYMDRFELIPGGETYLVAEGGGRANINIQSESGSIQFWDGDDRMHIPLNPGAVPHSAWLTSGVRNYHLDP